MGISREGYRLSPRGAVAYPAGMNERFPGIGRVLPAPASAPSHLLKPAGASPSRQRWPGRGLVVLAALALGLSFQAPAPAQPADTEAAGVAAKPDAKAWKRYRQQANEALQARKGTEALAALKAELAEARKFGTNDERLQESYLDLGHFWWNMREYATAARAFGEAVTVSERVYGPKHHQTANCLVLLGQACQQDERDIEAMEAFARAKPIIELKFGAFHPYTAICLRGLGRAHTYLNETNQAEECLKKALEIAQSKYSDFAMEGRYFVQTEYQPLNLDAAAILGDLGKLYERNNRLADAESSYKKAVETTKKNARKESRLWGQSLNQLARFYMDHGNWAAAQPVCLDLLKHEEQLRGANSLTLLPILDTLGTLYERQANPAELERVLKRQIAILEQAPASAQYRMAQPVKAYEDLLRRQNRAAEAEALEARHPAPSAGPGK